MGFLRALLIAAIVFMALFGARLAYVVNIPQSGERPWRSDHYSWSSFEVAKKNYASGMKSVSAVSAPPAQRIGNVERYEKVASIGQMTTAFETDRKTLFSLIEANKGVIQYESASGLSGGRRLDLGIGMPPENFDRFLEEAQAIGKLAHLSIVKNDRTNEYQKLRARRAALEKARAAVEQLRSLNATVDERLRLEERHNELEDQIQQLGIALGEFDTQNEFYTVKLTLQETARVVESSFTRKVLAAFTWSVKYYCALAAGLLALATALWIGVLAFKGLIVLAKRTPVS